MTATTEGLGKGDGATRDPHPFSSNSAPHGLIQSAGDAVPFPWECVPPLGMCPFSSEMCPFSLGMGPCLGNVSPFLGNAFPLLRMRRWHRAAPFCREQKQILGLQGIFCPQNPKSGPPKSGGWRWLRPSFRLLQAEPLTSSWLEQLQIGFRTCLEADVSHFLSGG